VRSRDDDQEAGALPVQEVLRDIGDDIALLRAVSSLVTWFAFRREQGEDLEKPPT
jgi:hypothetical protein